jgi:hypothetical protein
MKFTVSVVLLLFLCPRWTGLGREFGSLKVSIQDAERIPGAKENAAPTAPTPANPASVEENGKWRVSEDVSPRDGSRTVILILQAEQEVPASAGPNTYPRLEISCKSHHVEVSIHTSSLPAGPEGNGKYNVRLRLDDGQPFTQFWDQSTGQDSLSAPHPWDLARMLAAAKRLGFEFMPLGYPPVATWFDLNGLDGEFGKVTNACGSSAQSGSTESVKVKSSPPDLRTIRKVYLETEWAIDDNARPRDIKAIEKHTCLQVVETPGAADAILNWTMLGFTGATLELQSKDGQTLWSRSGLTPPLKALKQAVGCP